MARPIRSFGQRMAAKEVEEALSVVTTTERLLALIFIELIETRSHNTLGQLSKRLRAAGFSKPQAAGLLGTTTATLSTLENRLDSPRSVDAVGQPSDLHRGATRVAESSSVIARLRAPREEP